MSSTGSDLLRSNESVEWYTPSHIIDRVHHVLGGIDLDPACSLEARRFTRPVTSYSEGGLEKPWFGRVWCNPPGGVLKGKSYAGLFWKKMMNEIVLGNIEHAIWFAFNLEQFAVSQKYHEIKMLMFPFVVSSSKIPFLYPDGTLSKQAAHSCAFVYVPGTTDYREHFGRIFGGYGHLVMP